jgi:HEPN domain-containing protein
MPTRQELKDLAHLRLQEAEVLFQAACYNGAVYLCGYAVEAALKARICRLLGAEVYPDSGKYRGVYAVHDLDQLLFLAGLQGKMEQQAPLFENWTLAAPWKPDLRYSPPGTITQKQAADILKAIRDPKNGVLRWIKSYW